MDSVVGYSSDEGNNDDTFFSRLYHNMITFLPFYESLLTLKSDDKRASKYYYQNISITIVKGIVLSISWNSPLQITETIYDNVDLLDTEIIYERFKDELIKTYTILDIFGQEQAPFIGTVNINIDNMKMCMMRVKDNLTGDFLILPVWKFMGDIYVDERQIANNINLIVINALDGKNININLGY